MVPPYRTGYDATIAHRGGKKFAYVAKGNGVVQSIRNNVMRVKYADGTVDGVEVGRVFTKGAGHIYPNTLAVTVKEGDQVAEGDVLVYNTLFFAPDFFNPRQVGYKAGVLTRVALLEAPGTLEDSSVISEKLSGQLTSHETEPRDIVLDFKDVVHQLVKEGDHVEADSILCILEDASTEAAQLFGESGVNSLRNLAASSPKAKVAGTVERIEIFYNGDTEDMSESLRAIVEKYDAKLAKKSRDLNSGVESGRANEAMRVNNNPLAIDSLLIRVYITHGRAAFAGDKGVFGNQMKSVFGRVMTGENVTESGLEIDAIFSDKSIEDRIVMSARLAGMANALLLRIGQNVVAAYRGK